MTIKAVFRVQCDGPCKGWLSLPDTRAYRDLVVRPSAELACNYPGERAARRAALGNGWTPYEDRVHGRVKTLWRCPTCRETMLETLRTRIPHGRLGARFIVTGKYTSEIKGIPYSSIDVPVDLYQDKQLRYGVEHDVTKHFEGHTAGTEVTDIEAFWVWMPDGDRIGEGE